MDNATRRVFCDICGIELQIEDAERINIGRRTKYMCSECHRKGLYDVTSHEIYNRVAKNEREWK